MVRVLIVVALVGCAMGAVMQYPVKLGEKLELSLGTNIRVWERNVNGQDQTMRHCGPTEKNIACGKWVDKNGSPVASGAIVNADGTLVIAKVTKGDAGSYSSPDELVRVTKTEDGGFSGVARSQINVIVE
ncbi:hypothetical protein PRIPAC_79176 [Pristionchus pacificus]|uniref:Uncharacterized protein n=1 Tax=Pristionchus pacificus TaxID=54126 RepID=A0A454XU46_PRIPA|nr:hypothetical protein PRIPAC_79176 [Pristionchus pacificus]|eukprot:PDM75655.1 hypothetical protein PRIPAC_42832 [Pristionchus pacificus]